MRTIEIIWSALEYALAVLVFAVFATVAIQVVGRYCFGYSFSWTVEVTKLSFIWLVFLGVAIGARRRSQITIDALTSRFGDTGRRIFGIVAEIVSIAVIAILIKAGGDMSVMSSTSTLPSIGLPLSAIYIPACVAGVLIVFNSLLRLYQLVVVGMPADPDAA